jgi:hypothetical protein
MGLNKSKSIDLFISAGHNILLFNLLHILASVFLYSERQNSVTLKIHFCEIMALMTSW